MKSKEEIEKGLENLKKNAVFLNGDEILFSNDNEGFVELGMYSALKWVLKEG